MRCKNCGWENPEGLTKCEKCHGILESETQRHNDTTPASDRLKSTVAERVIFSDEKLSSTPKSCPKCGYPISDNSSSCPNCNYELQPAPTSKQSLTCKSCGAEITPGAKFCSSCGASTEEGIPQPRKIQRSNMGTVMGGPVVGPSAGNKFCTLRPIPWEGEEVNYNPITYSGNAILLNRANTDANNNSITSKEQALLTCEDGEWYIENKSDLRTTFIRVNGKIKLTSGDIIVLGNREFEFKG